MWRRCVVAIMLLCTIVLSYPLTVVGGSIDDIEIPVSADDYKSHIFSKGGYFVTLENTGEDNWRINRISTSAPDTRGRKKSEEIIFVNNELTKVRPYFVNANVEFNILYGRLWHCDKSASYEICKSAFGSRFISVRKLDDSKIKDVIKQTNMLGAIVQFKGNSQNEAKVCKEAKEQVADISKKLKIEPIYEDLSGLYNNENVIVHNLNEIQRCPIDLSREVLKLTLSPIGGTFNIQINPKEYLLNYNTGEYILKPKVRILSKNINHYRPDESFKNDDLEILLKEVETKNSTDVEVAVDVTNKSVKYISLSYISLYVNDSILTIGYNLELPPKAAKRNVVLSFSGRLSKNNESRKVYSEVIAALNTQVTKNSMKSDRLSIGVSAKYDINKSAGSLFDTRTIPIGRMLP